MSIGLPSVYRGIIPLFASLFRQERVIGLAMSREGEQAAAMQEVGARWITSTRAVHLTPCLARFADIWANHVRRNDLETYSFA